MINQNLALFVVLIAIALFLVYIFFSSGKEYFDTEKDDTVTPVKKHGTMTPVNLPTGFKYLPRYDFVSQRVVDKENQKYSDDARMNNVCFGELNIDTSCRMG